MLPGSISAHIITDAVHLFVYTAEGAWPGMLISMIAIDSDTIGDTFEVSLSLSAILLGGSIAIAIGDNFFRLYRYRLSRYFYTVSLTNRKSNNSISPFLIVTQIYTVSS